MISARYRVTDDECKFSFWYIEVFGYVIILCSYWPIVRSRRENIWTVVLKYGPNEVRSVRKAKVQIFSCMDRTNWSIRALLYSHNQHIGLTLVKMILYWIIMTIYTLNSFSSIFIRILPEYLPIPLSHLKRIFHSKNQNLLEKSLPSILFVYWCRPSIFRSNNPFWRSNTALDGLLINQSNRLFLSGYTISILVYLCRSLLEQQIKLVLMFIRNFVWSRAFNTLRAQAVLPFVPF